MTKINYQQIYEEEVSDSVKTSLEKTGRFFELSSQERLLVEDLVDAGYQRAIEDNLDTDILTETIAVADEMATQLSQFADMLKSFVSQRQDTEES
tara:strand:+ start:169 stop:453 length:285 start_codon:yes stop_codon:yes gene_type:complete